MTVCGKKWLGCGRPAEAGRGKGPLEFYLGERKPVEAALTSERGLAFDASLVKAGLFRDVAEAPAIFGPASVEPQGPAVKKSITFMLEPLESGDFDLWLKFQVDGGAHEERRPLKVLPSPLG